MPADQRQGYLYIATGDSFVEEAGRSVASLRRVHPEAHATLVTDAPTDVPGFDQISVVGVETEHDSVWKKGTLFKVRALQASPYDHTFFVDTDTYFCDRCDELFDLLRYYDLLICHAPGDVAPVYGSGKLLEGYHPYNTGVMVYRRSAAMHDLFERWHDAYLSRIDLYPHDQPAFMEALLDADVKLYVLQPNYNFRTPYLVSFVARPVKIIHGRPRDYERLARTLNERIEHRTWVPQKRGMIYQKLHWTERLRDRLYDWAPPVIRRLYRRVRGRRDDAA